MSASQWDRLSLASADGLLTTEECSMLLDIDIFNTDDDLLRSFPNAVPKSESFHLQEEVSTLYPPSPSEIKPSPAELANDLLQQLESQCKQENIFPSWLEEKVELPIFEAMNGGGASERAMPPAPAAVPVAAGAGTYIAPQPTEELLREFETVYGAVELTHLTPPQSPPGPGAAPMPATQLLQSYAQQALVAPAPALDPWQVPAAYECSVEAVDELVRARAAHLASPLPSAAASPTTSGFTSPRSSAPSSPRSSTDDEWSAGTASSRGKPYARGLDDRRSRKKEQNKNAATRYRQKKKAEIEVLLGEEQALRARHTDLGDKCADLQREIRYLKGLMRDLFKAKGLIK